MKIIYEDKNLLVIDKPAKKLTIATTKEKERTLYHEARTYVKKQNPKNKIFIVHRLDKDTSGLIIFAKNEKTKLDLQNNWSNVTRNYYAIAEGKMPQKKDTIISYLKETKTNLVYVTNDIKNGKKSITEYTVLAENDKYSLLKINIKTGRKNQIRAQLSYIGHPIVGDKKYNSKINPLNRLALHAYALTYKDPKSTINFNFKTELPKEFTTLIKKV